MPPKTRITRDMVLDTAFSIARTQGIEKVNARSIADALNCSTQPIMYTFATMDELRAAVYQKADEYHTEWLLAPPEAGKNPLLSIGLRYVLFAAEEPQLFRLLFQSHGLAGGSIAQLIDSPELAPIMGILCQAAGCMPEQAKQIFFSIFLTAHGYASLLANNALPCHPSEVEERLTFAFVGALSAVKGENK